MRLTRCAQDHRQVWFRRQQGQAVLLLLLLLGTVSTLAVFGLVRPKSPNLEDVAQTERALAQAKEALIAYAAGREIAGSVRPGELPCPDTNNNGTAEANCGTLAARTGRLPWATLGIPDVRDGSGERLWYTVSNNFKNNPPVVPLNSNTAGQLTVTGITPAANVIAIVFAPGTVTSGQSRTPANINSVAHYLDGENANGDTIFTTGPASATFNDRLLAITPGSFFPAVEARVAGELRNALRNYYQVNLYFPPANAYGVTCTSASQGLIPQDPTLCGVAGPALAPSSSWLSMNRWFEIFFYAVAPACMNPSMLNCTGAGGLLTVDGTNNVRALIVRPGTPYGGQARPCKAISDCLEPPNASSFPVFTHAPGSTTSNDRVLIVAP